MRPLACLAAVACCLVATCLPRAFASELLTVSPASLFPATNGVVGQRPSLFGRPNFREDIVGQVIYPGEGLGKFGCTAYDPFFPEDSGASVTLVALIDRGGNCSFSQKVKMAQDAGAQAVIIVNDDVTYGTNLPYMAAGPEGKLITIPAMLILGSDGAIFKANLDTVVGGLQVSMSFFLPNPDDRVEIDLYQSSATDALSNSFRHQLKQITLSMGERVLFEPHYQINTYYRTSSGYLSSCNPSYWVGGCTDANLNARCGQRCINCGRYCQVEQDGATGAEVVLEQMRAKCVWLYGNSTKPAANTYWFDYVSGRDGSCPTMGKFNSTCSNAYIAQLGVPASFITACMGATGFKSDNQVPIAQLDVAWQSKFNPFSPPQLYVNEASYHGEISCSEPLGLNCPPLAMTCAGFVDGTQPAACSTSAGCALGVRYDSCNVCAGDNSTCTGCDGVVNSGTKRDACGSCLLTTSTDFVTDTANCPPSGCDGIMGSGLKLDACGDCMLPTAGNFTTDKTLCAGWSNSSKSSSGFPVGGIIGIVLAAVILIGGGVYFYMRRQNAAMKDDIDALLKQYLPLEGTVSQASQAARRQVDQTRLMSGINSNDPDVDDEA